MAEIKAVVTQLGDGVKKVEWESLASGDTGAAVRLPAYPKKTVQATGDATSVPMEGSNDGTNFASVQNPSGSAVAVDASADAIDTIVDNPEYIRVGSLGSGTDTTITMIVATNR